jgi:hypothetical protein
MTQVTCEKCGGVYWPVQADGSLYVHVCPPPPPPEPPKPGWLRRVWARVRRK